ncbi:MAG: VOC family protein [Acidobacteriota bacterium]|nr:VOC family protein [Acidobacteriota bacterium]
MKISLATWALLPLFALADSPPLVETTRPMLDVTMVTNDGAAAKMFYEEIVGLKPLGTATIANGAQLMRYQAGSATLRIVTPKSPVAKYSEAMDKAIGIRGLALYLPEGSEGFAKRLASHGRPEPKWITAKTGIKLARLTDPDGNWLELIFTGKPLGDAEPRNQMGIILMVADEARSREFYGKTLGLKETPPHGKVETGLLYAYASGGSTILVKGIAKDAPNHAGKITEAVGYRGITFYVSDVDSLVGKLQDRGVKIAVAPFDHAGMRGMYALDPDGNWLEFLSTPKTVAVLKQQ